jgi:hypothetical protein
MPRKVKVTYRVPITVTQVVEVEDYETLENVVRDHVADGYPCSRMADAVLDEGDIEIYESEDVE